MAADAGQRASSGLIKGPQAIVGGVALMALAAFALYLVSDLSQGTLRSMGPAMLPRWLAIGVGACGLMLAVAGFLNEGHQLESVSFRGPIMVVLGIVFFAVTIRGELLGMRVPQLGLLGAGPLAMFIGGFATPDVRWRDLLILSLALTAGCMILFGDLLNLPIPLYPQWMSDLYPQSFSNDMRMRVTAGGLVVLAMIVYFAVPVHKEPVVSKSESAAANLSYSQAITPIRSEQVNRSSSNSGAGGAIVLLFVFIGLLIAYFTRPVVPILGIQIPLSVIFSGNPVDREFISPLLWHLGFGLIGGAIVGGLAAYIVSSLTSAKHGGAARVDVVDQHPGTLQ